MVKKNQVLLLLILFLLSPAGRGQDRKLFYQVEKGDTFGEILLSLGYLHLWSEGKHVNRFKTRVNSSNVEQVAVGDKLSFDESEIIFKKNVSITHDQFYFKEKISTKPQWQKLMGQEGQTPSPPEASLLGKKVDKKNKAWEIYPGIGGFVARNNESDDALQTTTITGLQPMVQLKAIYSHEMIGSLAFDVLAKQILNSEFSFPVNTDLRFQYVANWASLGPINLALSYSSIRHSYVGKPDAEELAYELKANFLGLGIVIPQGDHWYEFYFEKMLAGEAKSRERMIDLESGWRIDSELIYPLSQRLRLIPGINYYSTKNSSDNYTMKVLEFRTTLAWEIDL